MPTPHGPRHPSHPNRSTAMHDTFTDIELIARHRIAERVRYSPRAPKRR